MNQPGPPRGRRPGRLHSSIPSDTARMSPRSSLPPWVARSSCDRTRGVAAGEGVTYDRRVDRVLDDLWRNRVRPRGLRVERQGDGGIAGAAHGLHGEISGFATAVRMAE